ncbi:MAG: hypothetical protein P4L38_13250 [Syntrophaceae bacterium]|nr:hypothetical protein [Syntrophaceae bacterium]
MRTLEFLVVALIIAAYGVVDVSNGSECNQEPVSRLECSAWKLGRGITNILFAPCELYAGMTNSAVEAAYEGSYSGGLPGYISGAVAGYVAGSIIGVRSMLRQINQGLIQTATFWNSESVCRRRPPPRMPDTPFGPDDCLDPDPFWFNGPIPIKNPGMLNH